MKIIALFGRHDCGKSQTIGVHLRRMLHSRMKPQPTKLFGKDERENLILESVSINVCPPGDNEKIVLDNISFFKTHPFDVAFTATRCWGRGCDALKKYANMIGAELVWVKKPYNDNLNAEGQEKANYALAKELMGMM